MDTNPPNQGWTLWWVTTRCSFSTKAGLWNKVQIFSFRYSKYSNYSKYFLLNIFDQGRLVGKVRCKFSQTTNSRSSHNPPQEHLTNCWAREEYLKVWPQQRDLEVIAAPVHTWRVYREDEWRMKQFNHSYKFLEECLKIVPERQGLKLDGLLWRLNKDIGKRFKSIIPIMICVWFFIISNEAMECFWT